MSAVQTITIEDTDSGSRLDRWFKRIFPHITHGRVEKLLRKGEIRVDGKRAKGNFRLEAGQVIRVPPLPDPTEVKEETRISDTDRDFMRNLVIYEDKDVFALNKPFGLAVQGGTKTTRHIDGLLPALGQGCRLVHRLDRDTSGVLLIAKSAKSAAWAGKAFQSRQAGKIYWGVTNGIPKPTSGEIKGYMVKGITDDRFGKKNEGREVMMAVRHGTAGAKHARTVYQKVSSAGNRAAWMVMQPMTGRTHQLRLHMQLLGAPIVGDPKYMTDRPAPGGLDNKLHLHARYLRLPRDGKPDVEVTADLPPHMKASFDALGFDERMPIPEMEI